MQQVLQLHQQIEAAGIPIDGVSTLANGGYRIDFQESATEEQRAEAEAIAATFTPTSEPNWDEFIDNLGADLMVAIASTPMAPLITARMARLAIQSSEWQGESDRLLACWNAAPPALTAEQREALQNAAVLHSIPISVNENNLLSSP